MDPGRFDLLEDGSRWFNIGYRTYSSEKTSSRDGNLIRIQ